MSSILLNHWPLARSRVATQYTESDKFLAFLRALIEPVDELEAVAQRVALQTSIDDAEGVNLDVLGDIVGISRIVPNAIPVGFFGFTGQPGALTFGEEGSPAIGGRWREEGESEFDTSVLNDLDYRLLIKAKIIKNHAKATNEDILKGMSFLFGQGGTGAQVAVEDNGGMEIQVSVGRELSHTEKALITNLDILPKPIGVRINQRVSYDADGYFGFSDQRGALGFGETGQVQNWRFAEEF